MKTFILLLVCTASIVSAGVWDTQRILQGHGIQDEVDLADQGTSRISQMTQEDLLRQKFLLDILQHVNGPLLNEELLHLSQGLVEDQHLYNGGIDEEMLHVIQLSREQHLLGKHEIFSITNDEHLRQMIGLYRLMIRSRDWDTLKRNIVHIRAQVNGVLLVNSLLLAIRDRHDTQRLLMPAVHEILPELFHDEDLIRRVHNMNINQLTSTSQTTNSPETRRPGILEMIAVNRRANMNTNRVGFLDRTQLWMPWREMRMEINSRRIGGMKTPAQVSIRNDDRIVVPVQQRQTLMGEEGLMTLLTEDVGMKSFIHGLLNDLCLKEDEVLQNNMRQNKMTDGVGGRVGLERNVGSMLERERIDDMDRMNMEGVHGMSTNIDDEHLLHVGRRHRNDDSINRDNIMKGRVVVEQRQRLNDEFLQQQQQGRRQMMDIERDTKRGRADELLPTTSIDDKRLLHINRRRLHAAAINEMPLGRMHQLQDQVSGNTPRRHFLNIIQDTGRIYDGRHVLDHDLNDEDPLRTRMGMNMDWNTDVNEGMMRNEMNTIRNGAMDGHGLNRNANMRMVDNRLRHYQQQQQQQGNLDESLPTTAINDERLLHVGRRRLNEIQKNMGIQQDDMMNMNRRRWDDSNIIARIGNQKISMMHRENIYDGRRVDVQDDDVVDRNRQIQIEQQRRRQMIDIDWNVKREHVDEQLPSTSIDDKRLLHINRRRLHDAAINEMPLGRMHQLQDQISGNTPRRHFLNIIQDTGRIYDGRHVLDHDLNEEDPLRTRMGMNMDWNTDVNEGMMRNEMNTMRNGAMDGHGLNRNANMRMVNNRLRHYQQQQQQQGNLDESLPTTAINDERLLHVGRRRLNEIQKNLGIQQDDMMNMNRRRWDDSNIYTHDENIHGARRVDVQGDDVVDRNFQHLIDAHRNNMDIDNGRSSQNVRQVSGRGMENIGIHDDSNMRLESLIHDRLREESMAQRRGAMHDNWNWNMNTNRRRIVDDDRNVDVDMNRDMWHRRSPRSIMRGMVMDRNQGIEQERSGELLLHNLQQLMARINMERISLCLPDILQITNQNIPQHWNNPRLAQDANERLALRLNDMRLDTRRNRLLLDRINDIERRLTSVIEQEIQNTVGGIHGQRLNDIDRKIGNVLLGKSVEGQTINLLNILREVLLQTGKLQSDQQTLAHVGVDLQDPILMHVLRRIVRIADLQRGNVLGAYHREDLQLNGVTVNEVTVDKLQTIVDTNDVDLINLLDSRVLLGDRSQINRMVVARHQRLNHKSFTINMDITADRNQRVVIRTLLGPKVDGMGREVQINEQRHNFMLLDAHEVNLQAGRNAIKRKSRDITWTMRDTTPLSDIYRRVIMAIDGHLDVTLDQVQGQNCQFPHRLLLPRGRTGGLPMQLLVIVTPLDESSRMTQNVAVDNTICGIGMGSLNLDRLPLGFPLDRPIDDIQQLLAVTNLHLIDVKVHHDD